MIIASIPRSGRMNWPVIPFAIAGLLFSVIGKSNGDAVICTAAVVSGMLRRMTGGGIV